MREYTSVFESPNGYIQVHLNDDSYSVTEDGCNTWQDYTYGWGQNRDSVTEQLYFDGYRMSGYFVPPVPETISGRRFRRFTGEGMTYTLHILSGVVSVEGPDGALADAQVRITDDGRDHGSGLFSDTADFEDCMLVLGLEEISA